MTVPGSRHAPTIDAQVFDAVIEGVRLGHYHLVLGAGASNGSTNQHGDPLPVGVGLEKLLLDAISAETEPGVGLQRAYEAAASRLGQDQVNLLLRGVFSGCVPTPWHLLVPKMAWKCVWTFNVDDVMEHGYLQCTDRKQTARSVVWRDRPIPLDGAHDTVPIVHLHGYVGDVDQRPDPQLIFSLLEYLDVIRQADRVNWQTTFRGSYPTAPVIVIGARLRDEIDFAGIIRDGNNSQVYGYPSIVVLPEISEFEKNEFLRWGLTPVESTGEEFFAQLIDGVVRAEAEKSDSGLFTSRYTERTLAALPRELAETIPTEGHDFYGGHEPEWFDVVSDLDAVPRWIPGMTEEIGTPETTPNVQRLYVLAGNPFTGKSTALLRVARDLQLAGWDPVALVGWDRVDIDDTLRYFSDRPRAILIVDPLGTDATDVAALLRRADRQGQRLIIIGSDRARRLEHIRNVVSIKHLVGVVEPLFFEPQESFWWSIFKKRRVAARLGRLEGANEQAAKYYFVEHGRDLYSSLAGLEDAQGFISRGLEVYTTLEPRLQTAFATIALVGRSGLPTPANVAAQVAGIRPADFLGELKQGGVLAEWIITDRNNPALIKLRHRYLGDLLLRGQVALPSGTTLADISSAVCIAIADRISKESIQHRTLEYRLVVELMDEKFVHGLLTPADVDGWYAQLEPLYNWNARYWEQRALASHKALDKGYSFAKRAVTIRRDGFTLNTLATLLMRRAVSETDSIEQRRRYWQEALEALIGSRDYGRGEFEHPYRTFFHYTGLLLQAPEAPDALWMLQLEGAYRDWYAAAVREGIFEDPELAALARQFPSEWNDADPSGQPAGKSRTPRT